MSRADMRDLKGKWESTSPTSHQELEQMVNELKLVNRFTAAVALEKFDLPAKKLRVVGSWHAGLLRFTSGRLDRSMHTGCNLENQLMAVRAAMKQHEASLDRLERNNFSLELELDTEWLGLGGNKGCPNFSTLAASFENALTAEQTAIVRSHFDHCDACAEKYDADPSLSGYFPSYEFQH